MATYYNLRDGVDPVPVYNSPAAAANNTQTVAPAAVATTTTTAGTPVASNGTRNSYVHNEYANGTANPTTAGDNAALYEALYRATNTGTNPGTTTGADPNDPNPNPNQTGEKDEYGNPTGFNYNRYYGRGSGGTAAEKNTFEVPTLPSAASQEEYINAMYAANEAAARERLQAEYENNMAASGRQEEKLAPTYDAAANQAAAQAAINQRNFNEMAAASGLNSGAGSQARLSQDNAFLGNVSAIRRAQADAQAELDFQRTQMEAQYQQAIREAVAQNDLQKAQALYQEAKRVDESLVSTAVNQANMDWTVWNALYNKR